MDEEEEGGGGKGEEEEEKGYGMGHGGGFNSGGIFWECFWREIEEERVLYVGKEEKVTSRDMEDWAQTT